MRWVRIHVAAVLAVLSWCGSGFAQLVPQSEFVTGTGTVSRTRVPETMRLQVAILGRGATLKDALASLKDRTAKAQTQLVALGAEKSLIKIAEARITELPGNRNQQMQIMMQRMKRGGKNAHKNQPVPPVLVTAQLTADWALTSKTVEELLLTIHPIQEKIKAADLAGSKEAEKLTPEQEELLEEAEQNFGYSSSDEPKPGEPMFYFVSQVTEAEREQALAEAFEKAKSQAVRLAKAAGVQLGGLRSLNEYGAGSTDYEDYGMNAYNSSAYRVLQMARRQQGVESSDDGSQAIGAEPGMVKYSVSISASFSLEPKK